ncbi:MAG: hypothetical protein IT577_16060 [Verrucomicrobiae bacterium]|nr:hypothetical protein [Verrucomicrobiae bacterium]
MALKILVIFLGGYWFISAGVAAWIGRQKGRMIEGLGLGILMGPIGPILIALLPDLRKAAFPAAHGEGHAVDPQAHEDWYHHGEHEVRAIPVAELDAEGHDHGARGPVGARGAMGREGEFAGDVEVATVERKALRIDWLWVIFYGGWSLFVVFCWLWLLVYV